MACLTLCTLRTFSRWLYAQLGSISLYNISTVVHHPQVSKFNLESRCIEVSRSEYL